MRVNKHKVHKLHQKYTRILRVFNNFLKLNSHSLKTSYEVFNGGWSEVTLLRTSVAMFCRVSSVFPPPPPLEPPWVSSTESNKLRTSCSSREMSTFSCMPNTSGCCVTGKACRQNKPFSTIALEEGVCVCVCVCMCVSVRVCVCVCV